MNAKSLDIRREDALLIASPFTCLTYGLFMGGWTTRPHGQPAPNVHALQIELACGDYMDEPAGEAMPAFWPIPFSKFALRMEATLRDGPSARLTFV